MGIFRLLRGYREPFGLKQELEIDQVLGTGWLALNLDDPQLTKSEHDKMCHSISRGKT